MYQDYYSSLSPYRHYMDIGKFCKEQYKFNVYSDNDLKQLLNTVDNSEKSSTNSIKLFREIFEFLKIKKDIPTNSEALLEDRINRIFKKDKLSIYEINELKKILSKINNRNKEIIKIINGIQFKSKEFIIDKINKFIFTKNNRIIKNFNCKSCYFCPIEKKNEEKKGNILYETKNFYIKLGYGIIAPGHIMIIPKEHVSCYGNINNNQKIEEFNNLQKETCNFVKRTFNSNDVVMCEYGSCGQSVPHAHLHLIPANASFEPKLKNKNSNNKKNMCTYKTNIENIILEDKRYLKNNKCKFIEKSIHNTNELVSSFKNQGSYIYNGSSNKTKGVIFQPKNKHSYELMQDIPGYRGYFDKMGLLGVGSWSKQTENDKLLDNMKRQETLDKMKNIGKYLDKKLNNNYNRNL